MDLLAWIALACAALPAGLGLSNLLALQPPRPGKLRPGTLVSILVPARNEEANIGPAVEAALASRGAEIEVVVMDDNSADRTAEIVRAYAAGDPRLRLEQAPPLPPGWSGKVHACQRLADAARGTHLLFIDADVRLEPGAAAALAAHAERTGSAFVSAVPRQVMRSLGELLTVPAINMLLMGYLPMRMMRRLARPELGAACGQIILVEREAYAAAGGHAAIRAVIHDGMKLVRRFREAGFRTDLVLGSGLATCRMYRGLPDAWAGFAKNATEGMATPVGLPIWTFLLAGGHLLPVALALGGAPLAGPAGLALALSFGFRAAITARTRETWWTVPLHPATALTGLAIQWTALARAARGMPSGWKGRVYPAG